jgi:hypothetical protein
MKKSLTILEETIESGSVWQAGGLLLDKGEGRFSQMVQVYHAGVIFLGGYAVGDNLSEYKVNGIINL